MVVSMLVSLYTARVFLNILGASDYGLYILLSGVVLMFGFLQGTLTRSSLRYLCYYKAQDDIINQKKVFSISFFLHLVISLIIAINLLILSCFLFSGFLNIDGNRIDAAYIVYYCMIISFVFSVMSVPYDSVLNANENMLYYSAVGIVESLMRLGLAVYLPFVTSDRLIFYAIFMCSINILVLIFKRFFCHWKYKECCVSLSYYDKSLSKSMISYAGWNFVTSITSLLSFNSMPLLLNFFFGTVLNASQGIASQVNGVLGYFTTNMQKALMPTINKSGGIHDIDKMMNFCRTGTKLSFLISSFFAIPIMVECPYILDLWLVDVPEWSVVFCILLMVQTVAEQFTTVYSDCIYANTDIRNYCLVKGFLNILPLFLVYIAFKYGAAPYMLYVIIIICWDVLGGMVIMYFNKQMYNVDLIYYVRHEVLPYTLFFLFVYLGGLMVTLVLETSLSRLLINTMLTCSLFVFISYKFILNNSERSLVRGIVLKFLKLNGREN